MGGVCIFEDPGMYLSWLLQANLFSFKLTCALLTSDMPKTEDIINLFVSKLTEYIRLGKEIVPEEPGYYRLLLSAVTMYSYPTWHAKNGSHILMAAFCTYKLRKQSFNPGSTG